MQNCCPNCGTQEIEKISEREIYCASCDKTFTEDKGKKVRARPPDRITQIESGLKTVIEQVKGINEKLKPKPSDDEFPFGREE